MDGAVCAVFRVCVVGGGVGGGCRTFPFLFFFFFFNLFPCFLGWLFGGDDGDGG